MRRLALLLTMVAFAGCGAQSQQASVDTFQGEEREVAQKVEDLEDAGRGREPENICADILASSLVDELEAAGTAGRLAEERRHGGAAVDRDEDLGEERARELLRRSAEDHGEGERAGGAVNREPGQQPAEHQQRERVDDEHEDDAPDRHAAACSRRGAETTPPGYGEAVTAFYVGLSAMQTTQEALARDKFDRVVALVPQEPAGWANLGLLLVRQQDLEQGVQRLAQAAALAPESAAIQRLQALAESQKLRDVAA